MREKSEDHIMDGLRARGKETIENLYGRDYDAVLSMLERLDERLADCAVGFAYGQVYNTLSLEPKTRELIMVSTLAALNYPDQMVTHVMAARNAGATEKDLKDALLLISTVAGIPAVIEGMKRIRKVFGKSR